MVGGAWEREGLFMKLLNVNDQNALAKEAGGAVSWRVAIRWDRSSSPPECFALATFLFQKSYNYFFGCLWSHLYSLWGVHPHLLSLVSTDIPLAITLFIVSYPPVTIFIRKWKTSVIIWENCVQLLKPTRCLFLASPHLKINSIRSHLPSLCQSPAAIPPAHLLPQMLSLSPPPSLAPHAVPLWTRVGTHCTQQPAASQLHLPPTLADILRVTSDPDSMDCTTPAPHLFAPAQVLWFPGTGCRLEKRKEFP